MAQNQYTIGETKVTPPIEWKLVNQNEDRITLRSPDSRQQATISVMHFGADASFEDFKILCKHRIESEKSELTDGFIKTEDPFNDKELFGMFYSGGDKINNRIFSGYLTLKHRELVILYVEGIGVDPADNLSTFKTFVIGLKRN